MEHTANPQPGGKPKTITVKQPWWSSDEPFEVVLVPRKHYTEAYKDKEHDVHLPDADGNPGVWLGSVEKYEGSIDTKIKGTRLRHEGKRRTLWKKQGPGETRGSYQHESRAEVIRSLKDEYDRREQRKSR